MNSGDYISRIGLGIGKCNPDVFEDKGYAEGWNAAVGIIEAAPPADVRPVVLCRKCKFCEKRSSDCLICHHPKNAYHAQARFCEPDDFCSYGEAGEWDGRYGDERSDA